MPIFGSLFDGLTMATPPFFPAQPGSAAPVMPGVGGPAPAPAWMQKLNSPMAQIGLAMLANSRRPDGRPTPLGQAAGNAVLGYQQQQRANAEEELKRKFMEAQIARMQQPQQEDYEITAGPDGKPVYTPKSKLGGATPYVQPQGQASLPREAVIAQMLDDPKTPDGVKKYLQMQITPRDAVPTYSQIPLPDGKYGVLNNRTGQITSTGITAPTKKTTGAAETTQDIGIQNFGLAVDEYLKVLPTLKVADYLNPDARAKIGTVYNNMMLQAKEAYRLGVLNGPDFEILQKVVTDPMSLKGAITSNEALGKQAKELQRIFNKMRGNINPSGVAADAAAQGAGPAAGGIDVSAIDAELARRGVK